MTAFNRGDDERLEDLFAQAPAFQWYSSSAPGKRENPKARNRGTLIDYFRRRNEVGDRLGLLSFQFSGNWGGHGNFGLVLRRSVPGFRNGDWLRVNAKGTASCDGDSVQFVVMTLGPPEPRS